MTHSTCGLLAAGAIMLAGMLVAETVVPTRPDRLTSAIPAPRPIAVAVPRAPTNPARATTSEAGRPVRSGRVTHARTASPTRTVAPAASGMVIAIDPVTGEIVMPERDVASAPSIAELQALARRQADELVTVRHADGSESIAHAGRFVDYTVVHIGPDGRTSFQCAHGAHGVRTAITQPARPASEEE